MRKHRQRKTKAYAADTHLARVLGVKMQVRRFRPLCVQIQIMYMAKREGLQELAHGGAFALFIIAKNVLDLYSITGL